MEQKSSKALSIVKEIGKWVLVIWLVWPLTQLTTTNVSFYRIMLGILLFVLFAGKMFYDMIIESYLKRERQNKYLDLLITVGSVTFMAIIVAAVILVTGLMIYNMAKEGVQDPAAPVENME